MAIVTLRYFAYVDISVEVTRCRILYNDAKSKYTIPTAAMGLSIASGGLQRKKRERWLKQGINTKQDKRRCALPAIRRWCRLRGITRSAAHLCSLRPRL